jgi:hypothetical protein
MNNNKNIDSMINSLSSEYRKLLKSILSSDEIEVYDEQTTVILAMWDVEVSKISETIVSIIGTKAKRQRKEKTDGPKRPMSAYLYFCKAKRAEVKEANPDMKATEITSELGLMWKEIKETEEVEQYNLLAKADKERYAAEVGEEPKEAKEKKTRKKKNPEEKKGPKKPKSAYLYFCEEKRSQVKEENPEMKPTEITSELGRLWNKIKETPKANKYKALAEAAKAQYEEAKGESSEETKEEKPKKTEKKKLPKAKKGVPKTGYQLFLKEQMEGREIKSGEKKKVQTELRGMWLEIKENDAEKFQDYNIRAKEMNLGGDVEEESEEEKESATEVEAHEVHEEVQVPPSRETEQEQKAEPELEEESEIEQESAEEDPSLVDARTLLGYLEESKTSRPSKDEFVEQVETLENLSDEIKEQIAKVKKSRTKTIQIGFMEKLIALCNETIESYDL